MAPKVHKLDLESDADHAEVCVKTWVQKGFVVGKEVLLTAGTKSPNSTQCTIPNSTLAQYLISFHKFFVLIHLLFSPRLT
jgi:hypothetical protein